MSPLPFLLYGDFQCDGICYCGIWPAIPRTFYSFLHSKYRIFNWPPLPEFNDAHSEVIISLLFSYYHLSLPLLVLFAVAYSVSLCALLSRYPDFMTSIYFSVFCICLDVFWPSWWWNSPSSAGNRSSQQLHLLSSFSFSFSSWWNCIFRNPMNSSSDSYITLCI